MTKSLGMVGFALALVLSSVAFGQGTSSQAQGGSMQGMEMDGGMMGPGMMRGQATADGGAAHSDGGGGMGGGMMGGMMQGGTMSCSQMMGGADVTVQNTNDGATIRLRAKSKDQVQQVQQAAQMMKNCMSRGGQR